MSLLRAPLLSILSLVFLGAACGPAEDAAEAPADSAPADAAMAEGEPSLDEMRALTEKYRDVDVALSEGYVPDPMGVCVTAEMAGKDASYGAMGVHYIRMDLVEVNGPPNPLVDGTGTHTDFRTPAILLYEPQADGSMELVGVENLVFEAAWKAAGNEEGPSFHGEPWEFMADDPATEIDEAHAFTPHYDKHVWLFRDNPAGAYTPYNPNVTCDNFTGIPEGHMPPMAG